MNLSETVELMNSNDYKERFKAEYYQTKERYERLKRFNTKIEASERMQYVPYYTGYPDIEKPKHDCPLELLQQQQHLMGEYLHVLELRAVIEKIEL